MDSPDYPIVRYRPGEVIVREGEKADALYIIESGAVEVYREPSPGQCYSLGVLRPGSVFGEVALLLNRPRTASAVAVTETQCRVMPRAEFERRLEGLDGFARTLLTQLIRHLLRTTNVHVLSAEGDAGGNTLR